MEKTIIDSSWLCIEIWTLDSWSRGECVTGTSLRIDQSSLTLQATSNGSEIQGCACTYVVTKLDTTKSIHGRQIL